jgi:hypothetical protein
MGVKLDLRERALESLWVFCNEVLFMAPSRKLHEKPHLEMIEYLEDSLLSNKLMLVPRDCLKTTIASTAYPLWMVLRSWFLDKDPNYRVIIDSATSRLSKMVLGQIKQWLKNEVAAVFGPLYVKHGDREHGLSIEPKTRSGAVKEPNFIASGIGSEKTGLHGELIVMDDLVTKDNVRSVSMREKTWDHYRMMQAILEVDQDTGSRTNVVIVGTRYSDDDLYGRIIQTDKELIANGKAPRYAPMIRSAVNEEGELFYPAKLSLEALADKRASMQTLFWAQYMNDPSKTSAPLKEDQLHWHSLIEFPALKWIRLSCDPSFKAEEKDHGDNNALVVCGWDKFGTPWILDVSLRRDLTVAKFVDLFFRMARKYQVDCAIIENEHQEALAHVLAVEAQARGHHFPIRWEKPSRMRGKANRWLDIQAYAERAGGVKIAKEIAPEVKLEILDEWTRAPFSRFDDFLDALQLQTMYLPVDVTGAPEREIMGRTVEDIVEAVKNIEGTTPYYGTLAERFPHIRALQTNDPDEDYFEDESAEGMMEELIG